MGGATAATTVGRFERPERRPRRRSGARRCGPSTTTRATSCSGLPTPTRARRPSPSRTPHRAPKASSCRAAMAAMAVPRCCAPCLRCTMPRAWACLRAKPPPRTAPRSRTSSSPKGRFLLPPPPPPPPPQLHHNHHPLPSPCQRCSTATAASVSLTPGYAATIGAGWLERGGAYVVANIRGGGEFGPKWHQVRCCQRISIPFPSFRGRGDRFSAAFVPSVRPSVRPHPPPRSFSVSFFLAPGRA